MTTWSLIQLVLYLVALVAVARPLGVYMSRVFARERTFLTPVLSPVERLIYTSSGVNAAADMRWRTNALALLLLNTAGIVFVYVIQRLQGVLPLNPDGLPGVESRYSFNTAVSFVTNTGWQGYAGESTMSPFTQMVALTVQNFVSAATGIAVAIGLIRGFVRKSASNIGNFWVDLVRATLYILLPLSILIAILLVLTGVPQTLHSSLDVAGITGSGQTLAIGPVASQEAIKVLGTKGGGFFNANSAHPFENPTPISNLIQMFSILVIPVALTATFGHMVGNAKQGWAIFSAMALLFVVGVVVIVAEQGGNHVLTAPGIDGHSSSINPGGNMEGKEMRFGITASALFAVITTTASCGAVNAMHGSFMTLGGLFPLVNMALGEVVFGGVGAGMYGMLVFAVITVFIAGEMVGRTPEYLGKNIEAFDVKISMLTLLVLPLAILGFTAVALATTSGTSSILNGGPHGLSEVLYAFTSAAANNGSAFAGLSANTPFYNVLLVVGMLLGRFMMIIPMLAMAGSLASRRHTPATSGTFPSTGLLWISLLAGVVVIVGALTYFPALAHGPLVECNLHSNGSTFPSS